MIAASQWQPAIPESESTGEINFQKRAQRDWLPGRCGLLPSSLLFGASQGCWFTCDGCLFVLARHEQQSASANSAFACECRGVGASHGAASAVTRAGQEYTSDAVRGWLALGPHSIFREPIDIRLL